MNSFGHVFLAVLSPKVTVVSSKGNIAAVKLIQLIRGRTTFLKEQGIALPIRLTVYKIFVI